jgi:tetratricopeptide (TPR) repeat protein
MVALRQGDYEVARRHYADCLAIARKFGDEEAVAEALVNLGVATLNLGDRVQAKSLFADSVSLFRESGNKSRLAESFYYFGFLALFEDDNQQAKSFFEQELALARTVGPAWLGAQALRGLAGVAATCGRALRAARLLGAAESRAKAAATYNDAVNSMLIGHTIATAVAQIGEAEFAAAYAEGWAMTFEQAADYALGTEPFA